MGTGQRSDLASGSAKKNPGPGNYEIDSKVGEGPKFVMGLKTESNALSGNKKVPGPGTYSPVKVTEVSSKYSMGAKTTAPLSLIVNPDTGAH